MSALPPARDGNPLQSPEHPYVLGPPPKRTRIDMKPSPHRQVHKVYGEDKQHWFVQCVVGRVTKDAPGTEPLDIVPTRPPVDTEHCHRCFSTRERLALRREASPRPQHT